MLLPMPQYNNAQEQCNANDCQKEIPDNGWSQIGDDDLLNLRRKQSVHVFIIL